MMRKILFFTVLLCAALPARAQAPEQYCISSEQLAKIRDETKSKDTETQRAYAELFALMLDTASANPSTAGCATSQELAQICRNTWGDNTEKCEGFVYDLTEQVTKSNFTKLTFTDVMRKTDFSDINPEAFKKAFDQSLKGRRSKSIPSKMQDMSSVFLEEAKKNNVNPFLTAAICMWESAHGTSPVAQSKNNIGGLFGSTWMSFKSVPDCIAYHARKLDEYVNDGLTNLTKIGVRYCKNCPEWPGKTASIGHKLYRLYNKYLEESAN